MQATSCGAAARTVRVEVDYRLAEYRAIVCETLAADPTAQGRIDPSRPWNKPFVARLMLALLLPPIFWLKKARVGRCTFEFDANGLRRHSRGGAFERSWQQVARVQRLKTGLLIELREGGALPLPHRVLSAGDREALEVLIRGGVQGAAVPPAVN